MKIAILIPGHLRAWEYCKQNFIEMLYDKQHQIDIFVDTYFQQFRIDCNTHDLGSYQKETQLNIILNDEQITNLFSHLNVVSLQIEDEHDVKNEFQQTGVWNVEQQKPIDGPPHLRKLHKIQKSLKQYEHDNGVYDLVVKTRPDILINGKINYDKLYEQTKKFPRFVCCGIGFSTFPNDMINIGSSETIHSLLQRETIDIGSRDGCEELIDMSVIRLDTNPYFNIDCFTPTRYYIKGVEFIIDNTNIGQRRKHKNEMIYQQ